MAITAPLKGDESDDVVLGRVQARDERALALLYSRHASTALALAYRVVGDRETAEEAVQEAFLSVWRGAAQFRPDRGAVRSWLLATVRNRAIDALRAREARPRTTGVEFDLPGDDDPERDVLSAVSGDAIRAAVAALPAEQRAAVELAYFAGLPYPEIANRIGVPLGTVKSRLRLALQRLRDSLAPEFVPAA